MVPSTHCPVGRSPSLGPRWKISLICRGNQQSYISLLAPSWNKAEKIAVVNSFSSMWLEINCALAAEGQRPSQWQAQPEASTKKDKRDLWPSAMIAVASLFSPLEDWTIYTHTKSRCDARRFTDASKAACGVQIYSSCGESRHRHSCKGESSMFALPDSRLAVANPRWGFDVCLKPASIFDVGRRLKCGSFTFELIAIKKKFCLRSHPQIGIHFLVAIASTHPQHWQWGRRGSVCGWPLWGPCNKERWPYGVLKGCACHASMFKMAILGSQAQRLPRVNL